MKKTEKFLLDEIFVKINTKKIKYKKSECPLKPTGHFVLPARTCTKDNKGLSCYVPKKDATILSKCISVSANGDFNAYYHEEEFTILQDSYALKGKKKDFNKNECLYLIAAMYKSLQDYKWTNKSGWEKVRKEYVVLPIKSSKHEVDWEYINKYMYKLKTTCINELKKEKTSYYEQCKKVLHIDNINLSPQDKAILKVKKKTKEFRIDEVLEWQKQIEIDPLKIKYLSIPNKVKYPFYGQSTVNNGIIGYYSLSNNVLNNPQGKPTILIHSNNQNCVYLESPFYLKDGHGATSVLQSQCLNRDIAFYLMTIISKIIKNKFSYNLKATKIALKQTTVKLPVNNNGKIDYDYMVKYINAIKKIVLSDIKAESTNYMNLIQKA